MACGTGIVITSDGASSGRTASVLASPVIACVPACQDGGGTCMLEVGLASDPLALLEW